MAPAYGNGSAPDSTNTTPGVGGGADWCFDGGFGLAGAAQMRCSTGRTTTGGCTQERVFARSEMRQQLQLACGTDDNPCFGDNDDPRFD